MTVVSWMQRRAYRRSIMEFDEKQAVATLKRLAADAEFKDLPGFTRQIDDVIALIEQGDIANATRGLQVLGATSTAWPRLSQMVATILREDLMAQPIF